jgi:hypothetical protein
VCGAYPNVFHFSTDALWIHPCSPFLGVPICIVARYAKECKELAARGRGIVELAPPTKVAAIALIENGAL